MKKAHLLGFATNLGLPIPRRQAAPPILRALGLAEQLQAAGYDVADLGDLNLPNGEDITPSCRRIDAVVAAAARQADLLHRHRQPDSLWVTLGGDHTTSLGTILGLTQTLGPNFDIVWIDAHADFNTPATSPTGNVHGMVLALATGLMPGLAAPAIESGRIHILGARNIDTGEQTLLRRSKVHVYGVAATLARLPQIIQGLHSPVFLSLDTDALDPAIAPAVHTPVPGGFSLAQAIQIVKALGKARRIAAVDLVEYAADLDDAQRYTGRQSLRWLVAAAKAAADCRPRHDIAPKAAVRYTLDVKCGRSGGSGLNDD